VLRGFLSLFLLSASQAFSGSVQLLPALPPASYTNAVQVDTAGNIYVAGEFSPNLPNRPSHAFVGKLSPDGLQIIWWTVLAGSQDEVASAIALGSDNSVYVTGNTSSTDFPTTNGSMQPTTSVSGQAFATKLNPNGGVVYSTYIGGTASTAGSAITVDASGDAFITGYLSVGGTFPTTPGAVTGAVSPAQSDFPTAFIIELNPAGSAALVAIDGFGGNAIALDGQGNIYAAGAFIGPIAPATPGAFQTTTVNRANCFSSFIMVEFCVSQHLAKIDPTGTTLIYATYLAGSYGASPSAIAIDASGNAIVAGFTNSPDYPTTPAAYQPEYFSNPEMAFFAPHELSAPAPVGYVSKLNASGTALIWSTLFGGSSTEVMLPVPVGIGELPGGDSISGMAIDAAGNILIAGVAQSSDLPGLWSTPVALRPSVSGAGFVARLSPDGTTLSPTQMVAGSSRLNAIALRGDGSAVVVGEGSAMVAGAYVPAFAAVSISAVGRVAAISDTADNAKIVRVAPGQLLTLYGTNLAPEGAAQASAFPTSLNGVTVTFNGIAAPILYTSGIQINLQVPYEVAGLTQVTMQVSSQFVSPPVSESYFLAVTERQPSVFISASSFSQPLFDIAACNGQSVSGLRPLALNADGTENSCANPAAFGSVVTIFLNGLGISSPMQPTGLISASAVPINPAASFVAGSSTVTNFLSTATVPGSIDSIAQVQIQVSSASPFVSIPLEVQEASEGAFWIRGPQILIWVNPAN
jgi:uncharacterized protein (TIGR03437 family)